MPDDSGALVFARYAFPPNSHGYCGPEDADAYFASGVAGDDETLRASARAFDGAWPFLRVIADAHGLQPLDPRVVDAYWIGNDLLDGLDLSGAEAEMAAASGPVAMMGREWSPGLLARSAPHHSFAVLCVYPWTPLLGDERKRGHALMVLDRCRIRWGTVVSVEADEVVVDSPLLVWDGGGLALGPATRERAVRSIDGAGMVDDLAPGDAVALHWEWVCDRLDTAQVGWLESVTRQHVNVVNERRMHGLVA